MFRLLLRVTSLFIVRYGRLHVTTSATQGRVRITPVTAAQTAKGYTPLVLLGGSISNKDY
jgi:hypothetical protein